MVDHAARANRIPRKGTPRRREDILRAALHIFGTRGYRSGSLAEIAGHAGMTHSGVLHHFASKDQLLLDVLTYRDETDVAHLEEKHMPPGLGLFRHLVETARLNATRPGIVQAFTVLSGDSVTEEHPAQGWFRARYGSLREEIRAAFRVMEAEARDTAPADATVVDATVVHATTDDTARDDATVDDAAASILAVMDGLQIQWLLDRDDVNLARATQFAIEAIMDAASNPKRPRFG